MKLVRWILGVGCAIGIASSVHAHELREGDLESTGILLKRFYQTAPSPANLSGVKMTGPQTCLFMQLISSGEIESRLKEVMNLLRLQIILKNDEDAYLLGRFSRERFREISAKLKEQAGNADIVESTPACRKMKGWARKLGNLARDSSRTVDELASRLPPDAANSVPRP